MASILKVNTIQDATNSNTAMTISTGGVISEPNRPCFHVGKTADQTLSDGTVSTITFESITDGGDSGRVINKGGLFASNKFTVTSTTTGIYYFYTNLFGQSSGDATDTFVFFRKNDSTQMMSSGFQVNAGSNDDNYPTVSGSVTLQLSASETFGFYNNGGTYHTNSSGSYFCGHLLG